ncbi:MAG: bacterial Ig-like domain-containing protein [Treponema sp.]|nr:bacterial Ig-like domain-containing protein [Treponema sp.]
MKKLKFLTAALTSAALLFGSFGIISCSDDSGDDNNNKPAVLPDVILEVETNASFKVGENLPVPGNFTVTARLNGETVTLESEAFTVTVPEANIATAEDEARTQTLKFSSEEATAAHRETITATIALVSDPKITKDISITISDNATVTSLEITIGGDAKKEYTVGDEFDPTGITAKAHWGETDTTGTDVSMEDVTVTGFDSSAAVTGQEITFTYEGVTATKKLTINVVALPPYALSFVNYFSGSADTNLSEKPDWVTIDGTTITLSALTDESSINWGGDTKWASQLKLSVSAREGNVFEKGAKYHFSVDVTSSGALGGCVVKDPSDKGLNVEGIDYEAGTKKEVSSYFIYSGDTETSFVLLFAFGNCNKQRVVIENLKIEKLGDYDVTDLTLTASSLSASTGETVTLTAKDQYGFEVTDATFSFAEEGKTGSSIEGNTLTAGNTAGTAKVKATSGAVVSNTVEIIISTEKDYNKYWNTEGSIEEKALTASHNGYFSYFAEDGVELTDMLATETSATLTRSENKIGNNFWSTQIWYRVAEKSTLKFKVTSTVDGYITVANLSNKVINLEGNKASEEISVTLEAGANLSLQLGNVNGNSPLPAGTFTISDFSVTPAN